MYIRVIKIIVYDVTLNNIMIHSVLHMYIKRDIVIIFLRPSTKHFVTIDVFP